MLQVTFYENGNKTDFNYNDSHLEGETISMVRQWSLQFEKDITFDKIKTVLKKTTHIGIQTIPQLLMAMECTMH
jgi:hypothetical protein